MFNDTWDRMWDKNTGFLTCDKMWVCVCARICVTLTLCASGGSGSWSTLRWMSFSQASRSCDFLLYWYHWGAMASAFLFLSTRRSCTHAQVLDTALDSAECVSVCRLLPSLCCTCCWAACVWVWAALSCPGPALSSADSLPSTVVPSPHLPHSPTHTHTLICVYTWQREKSTRLWSWDEPCPPGNPPPWGFLPV